MTCPLYVGPSTDSPILADICRKSSERVALIADASVAALFAQPLLAYFKSHGLSAELFPFPPGEASKTREIKQALENGLLQRGFGRDTTIVALGGGVATDLAGFLAATYMRGVPLVLLPTSLLAMVDAAIGGKTAVNTPHGKNLIGAFYPPKAVFIDFAFLETLPPKEVLQGKAEILKYGLILDDSLFTHAADPQELILPCCKLKMSVVEQDPEEQGLRRILNFGHTVGHALEHLSRYRLSHGEAVALGCIAESFLSAHLGYLSQESLILIENTFRNAGFHLHFSQEGLLDAMRLDKKGPLHFVLIDKIGHALPFDGRYCREVPEEAVHAMIAWMSR